MKFTSRDVREKFYRARKVLKDITSPDLGFSEEDRIFINESLTQCNKEFFKDCLKIKKDEGFQFLWIKYQHEGSKVIQITDAKALHKIGEQMSYVVMIPP